MRVFCTVAVLVLVTATASVAQELPPSRPAVVHLADQPEPRRKVVDKKFWLLGGALNSAMLLDTRSTFDVTRTCTDCYEANPFVRPFVRRGPVTTYAAGEIFDAGVMTLAAGMRGSDHPWMRRTWWVVPVALMTGHAIAYRHNVNLIK
ncbi:MAG: hypothetical protein ABI211_18860 [Vicinamibacterales bacterium]